ncbi:hypothetical protein ACFWIA_05325 [Streptomyces sp. NPDC127068]|uniref:hypothetical protein n=1 Tax=Streptomyces sp. NPDC127068 TaxID=3347127 RepID=UPI003661CCD1
MLGAVDGAGAVDGEDKEEDDAEAPEPGGPPDPGRVCPGDEHPNRTTSREPTNVNRTTGRGDGVLVLAGLGERGNMRGCSGVLVWAP